MLVKGWSGWKLLLIRYSNKRQIACCGFAISILFARLACLAMVSLIRTARALSPKNFVFWGPCRLLRSGFASLALFVSSLPSALVIVCSFCLSSCGYRWQSNDPLEERPSLSLSFIPGDEDASLTNAVAHALASSGLVDLRQKEADFRLEVSILQANDETIGYRFNRQKTFGKVRRNLVATEGRRSLTIEAAIYKRSCDEIAYGPYRLTADADYDFLDGDSLQDLIFQDQTGAMVTVLPFSLGQLEPNEAAQQAALRPLYACLAQKIVNALAAEWCK